jgi:hypothetical protein
MKLRFDPDLDFQNQAIDAAVRLFEGAPDPKGFDVIINERPVPVLAEISSKTHHLRKPLGSAV